ncbi:MAG: methylated-DNA--[protein]-cysteine S-methyltransferase [Pseudomonadota bacterium]
MNLNYKKWQSPLGTLHLLASSNFLRAIAYEANWQRIRGSVHAELVEQENKIISRTMRELDEYFSGTRRMFSVLPAPEGTAFQKTVWACLQKIPYGETLSYREQARLINKPLAARAVGSANGRNPIAIIIPCHRVIGSLKQLAGYAGGIEIKRKLLELEGSL